MSEFLQICEKAARAGGAVIQDWVGRFDVSKKGPADLVTQADFASQQVVRDLILQAFPDHYVLGEETDRAAANPQADSPYRWIVDPLDGTTNYVHRVPHYCVSLALEHKGELLVGAVFDPNADECYTAAAGQGAWLNGQPIHTSSATELSESLAAVGFAPQADRQSADVAVFLEALTRCRAIRRTGSAALNLCYVAAGRFDLYWSYSTKVWDVAAGVLIVREAGGTVTSPDGGPFVLDDGDFLAAATGPLHEQLHRLTGQALPMG